MVVPAFIVHPFTKSIIQMKKTPFHIVAYWRYMATLDNGTKPLCDLKMNTIRPKTHHQGIFDYQGRPSVFLSVNNTLLKPTFIHYPAFGNKQECSTIIVPMAWKQTVNTGTVPITGNTILSLVIWTGTPLYKFQKHTMRKKVHWHVSKEYIQYS